MSFYAHAHKSINRLYQSRIVYKEAFVYTLRTYHITRSHTNHTHAAAYKICAHTFRCSITMFLLRSGPSGDVHIWTNNLHTEKSLTETAAQKCVSMFCVCRCILKSLLFLLNPVVGRFAGCHFGGTHKNIDVTVISVIRCVPNIYINIHMFRQRARLCIAYANLSRRDVDVFFLIPIVLGEN